MAQYFLAESGKEIYCHHGSVEAVARPQWLRSVDLRKSLAVEMYAESYFGQRGIVVALECIEIVGATLGGAVSTPEIVLEKDRYLADGGNPGGIAVGSYLQGRDQVFLSVSTHFADRELRACDYYRFRQVLEHERQRRGGVCHGVGAVQYHKAVVILIILCYDASHLCPMGRTHIR